MNRADIDRIKELLAKATPAPWKTQMGGYAIVSASKKESRGRDLLIDAPVADATAVRDRGDENKSNAELICLLRNTIEYLLDEREQLRDAIKDLLHDGIPLYDMGECHRADKEKAKRLLSPESGKEDKNA